MGKTGKINNLQYHEKKTFRHLHDFRCIRKTGMENRQTLVDKPFGEDPKTYAIRHYRMRAVDRRQRMLRSL